MYRIFALTSVLMFVSSTALSDQVSYLYCEYESLGTGQRKSQSIPLFYEDGELIGLGRESHCVGEREFFINDSYAIWRCITAYDADQTAAKSVFVEVNRFTGRFHRNDFSGHFNDRRIDEIWHGVCTAHHDAQF